MAPTTQRVSDIAPHLLNGINDSPLRRFVVIAALNLFGRFRRRHGQVLFLTNKICVKYGDLIQLSEAFTLQFIASHTSIPVPKVYCAFVQKGCTYIVMEKVDGHALYKGWQSRSTTSKDSVFAQLKAMVNEMRGLSAPGPGIANVLGGPLYDARFHGTSVVVGPFPGVHQFHLFLRNGMKGPPTNGHFADMGDMIQLQEQPWPMPVFTHGDLSMFNILVRGDRVVGIIDWETAGWYPYYWEYSMASLQPHPYTDFWAEETDRFMDPLIASELDMERTRLKYFGPL